MAIAIPERVRDRAAIDARYRWNLADLYPTEAAWRDDKARIEGELPRLRAFQDRLGESAATLADALALATRLDRELARLYAYASMVADEDTRKAGPQGMEQAMHQTYAELAAQAAFIEPEILKLGADRIETFIAAEPRLHDFAFFLRDAVRRAAHTLSDAEEKILADAGPLAASPSGIYTILSNADFPYPVIPIDGRDVKVDQATYGALRTSPDRETRRRAMAAFFAALGAFRRTFGTAMNAEVQKTWFYAKTRRFPSSLAASLNGPNIPESVYVRLVDGVNRALTTFHRYLRLRARMLGIDDSLHYYDLYAPLVKDVHLQYSVDEAERHVLAAIAPLGPEYAAVVARAFRERWIDYFPTDGKVSGAYSNGGAYDVHPYMLLNYLGQYNDVSTLAHELGHTMHSYYSNATQPYPMASYQTFVAEVASTFNEALLLDHLLAQVRDDATRLALLGTYLENAKTVFRQTQFAEFELRMHEMVPRGEPVTGESLATLYLDITRRYYGHEAGICIVDDEIANEWSYIPHFYRDFYVYQYATSFTAAEALSAHVLAGDAAATARFVTFLSSGGSKYPIDLLRDAGVDMTTNEPLDLTIRKMNAVMDEMEDLIAR